MSIQEKLEDNGYNIDDFDNSLQIDGYDDACVGVSENDELVYDYALLVKETMKDGCTLEQAIEYVNFNIVSAMFPGYISPVIVNLFSDLMEDEE